MKKWYDMPMGPEMGYGMEEHMMMMERMMRHMHKMIRHIHHLVRKIYELEVAEHGMPMAQKTDGTGGTK